MRTKPEPPPEVATEIVKGGEATMPENAGSVNLADEAPPAPAEKSALVWVIALGTTYVCGISRRRGDRFQLSAHDAHLAASRGLVKIEE